MNTKFSIIMPFFNSENYIERAVLSVVNQKYNNWELIAVNDGSQDKSFDIVNKYAQIDSRIRLVTKENGGYSTAINCGLDNIANDSDYFLMLGSDDELLPNILFDLVTKLNEEKIDIVAFRTICVYDDGKRVYDNDSYVTEDEKEFNTTLTYFYNKRSYLPQLLIGRDTSRLYKTSILGNLRYFGRYGVSADGIFSMLFSYKCKSFAHFAIDGYLWYLRNDSVSSVRPNDLRKEDNFINWLHFFQVVVENKYQLTDKSKGYINYYVGAHLKISSIDDKIIYKRNKKNLLISKKIIKILIKRKYIKIPFKKRIKIKFVFLYRVFCNMKRRNPTKKMTD